MNEPLVSVIIPARNAARYLGEAIESVLGQTSPPFEVIVVDDGSADDTAAIAARFLPHVRTIQQPIAGAGAARTTGIAAATGDFIALLDADDTWAPRKLEPQLAALAADPGAAGAFCYAVQFISPDLGPGERARVAVDETPMPGLIPSALLARRDVFGRVGSFDTSLAVGEFIDWHERARALGLRFVTLEDILVRRRIHATNMGRGAPEARADYLRVIKSALDRRRAGVADA